MSNKFIVLLFLLILIVLPQRSLYPATIQLKNDYIEIIGDPATGRFIIKTTGGDPSLTSDQNVFLLYEDYPPTSFTTLKIDDVIYKFGDDKGIYTTRLMERDDIMTAVWSVNMIEISQKLRFVKGPTTGNMDTVEISYSVLNKDDKVHTVGVRIMLDTYLGKEDGAPFRIPQLGNITTENMLQGKDVPEYWYSFDDLGAPTVRAQGTLILPQSLAPDKIIFTSWERFNKYLWDFDIIPGRSFRRSVIGALDSALAVFWEGRPIQPGDSLNVKTYYGLYGASIYKGKIFNISLGGPVQTSGNPFTVTADIQNISPYLIKDATAEIILPNGLKLNTGDSNSKNLGEMNIKGVQKTFWTLVPDRTESGYITFKVQVKGWANGVEENEIVERRIECNIEKKKVEYSLYDFSDINDILKKINQSLDKNNQKLDNIQQYLQSGETSKYPKAKATSDRDEIKKRIDNVQEIKKKIPEALQSSVKYEKK